jgi:HSP20 family protein
MAVIRHELYKDPFERLMSLAATGTRAPLAMPLDVYRSDDGNYHIEADLPGVDPASIEVTVEQGTLTMRADRNPRVTDSGQVLFAERSHGSFTRRLSLGEGVDADHLTASYADGVLQVLVPPSPRAQPRRVEVTHGNGSRTVAASPDRNHSKAAG